jgi:hypothetical protein
MADWVSLSELDAEARKDMPHRNPDSKVILRTNLQVLKRSSDLISSYVFLLVRYSRSG